MLPAAGSAPHGVLAVLRAHAAGTSGEDQLLEIGAQPLAGGRNNAVYQWESPGGPVCVKIYRVDDRCRAEREWHVLAEPVRRIFSRGDSNLLNWLWDGTSIRVVDYEFAGYSDLAFDCADLTEHISSRQAGIDDQAWTEIVCLAGLGGGDQRRFDAAQRTCALLWFAVLSKQRDKRTEEFTSQFGRVRRLQCAAAAI